MSGVAVKSPLRIAIGLSGGVDSAVTALVLRRCVHTAADVAALRRFGFRDVPPPPLDVLKTAVAGGESLHTLLPPHVTSVPLLFPVHPQQPGSQNVPVVYSPFFMRNWHDNDSAHGWCVRAQTDYDDAQRVARALDLLAPAAALPVMDFAKEYAEQCFQRLLHAYAAGNTLNVDVLCNSRIKFGAAARALHVVPTSSGSAVSPSDAQQARTLLATGHYARTWIAAGTTSTAEHSPFAALLLQPCSSGHDLNDQTHFLSRVAPSALAGALFPLGHLFEKKHDVRALARHAFAGNADVAHIPDKRTSTGICFVGPPPLPASASSSRESTPPSVKCAAPAHSCTARFACFLNEYLPPPPPSGVISSTPSSTPSFSADAAPCTVTASDSATRPHGTVFCDAVTRSAKYLVNGMSDFDELQADYPAFLPAYAVTVGQRLRLTDGTISSSGSSSSKKGKGKQPTVRSYYVARKVLCPVPQPCDAGTVRLLAEVHVVDRWDHPLLYTSTISVTGMRWWWRPPPQTNPSPTTAALRTSSSSDDTMRCSVACLCAVRHQSPPQPAIIEWTSATTVSTAVNTGVTSVHTGASNVLDSNTECSIVHRCTVRFETPVRAPATGQALVAYAPLSTVSAALTATECARHTLDSPSLAREEESTLVVIGSGWVEVLAEKGTS